MRHNLFPAFVLILGCLLFGGREAEALCTVPNHLTNGQLADATQVMANFDALTTCLNSAPGGSANAIQYNASGGAFGGLGPLTNGQLVIGSTGATPQAATLTAGSGIAISNGPGTISISSTGAAGGTGLYSQVMSAVPTMAGTGLTNWLNQSSATASDTPAGLTITTPTSGNSGNVISLFEVAPSAPYTITALCAFTINGGAQYPNIGLGWYDGTNKLHTISLIFHGSWYFEIDRWNSPTSFNSVDKTSSSNVVSGLTWIRLADDGTNVHFSFSNDGANFYELYSVAKSSGFLGAGGYSNIIFEMNAQAGTGVGNFYGTLMSWKVN